MQIFAFVLALAALVAFLVDYIQGRSYTSLGLSLLTLAVIVQLVWTSGTLVNLK